MTEISGSRAVVTGAAHGIGRLVAERLVGRGATVALVDINADGVQEAAESMGQRAHAYVADLSKGESIYSAARAIEKDLGGADILFNNAGVVFGGDLADVSDEQHQLTVDVNLMGVIRMTRALLPGMIQRRRGHIVNMASASGFSGVAHLSSYAASKWAVIGFSESMVYELQSQDSPVQVSWVCPGFIDTGMFHGVETPALMPLLQPDEVADSVIETIEKNRREVIMPRFANTAHIARALLPTRVRDLLAAKLGFNRSMLSWKGH